MAESLFESRRVQAAVQDIDRAGATCSKQDWIVLCEEVVEYFETAAEAAREELRAEQG